MPRRRDYVVIEYQIRFTSPFHFGTGLAQGLIDRTTARKGDFLYIPGSTIKGTVREICEDLAHYYKLDILDPHDEDAALASFSPHRNIVDRIFGSRVTPGELFFDDAVMVEEDRTVFEEGYKDRGKSVKPKYLALQIETRTQTSLQRLTNTVREGALYTSEFGQRTLRFEGKMYGYLEGLPLDGPGVEDKTYPLILLLAGVHNIQRLGGNKSVGMGECICQITSFSVNEQERTGNLEEYLGCLEDLEYYQIAEEGEQ